MKKVTVVLMVLMVAGSVMATKPEHLKALAEMKIKEITVFKDGHVFLLHSGKMPVNSDGNVVMDYLPAPVLGTYWPYSADKKAKLRSVVVGRRKVLVEKTALTVREMIEGNVGEKVIITECPPGTNSRDVPKPYEAVIEEIPTRSSEELESLAPASSGECLPEKGNVVMLKTDKGVKALAFDRILDVTFVGDRKRKILDEEFRNLLTLDLKWRGKPRSEADVGMIYLQKGIRWIPSYNIAIGDNGRVAIKLEATLINELADISDVTANLVIGVPSFTFKDSVDPISLRQSIVALSSNFRSNSQTAFGFSNSIMSQQMMPGRMSNYDQDGTEPLNLGPEFLSGKKSEDLYMFTVKDISLRKGERLVMPIAEYELAYEDIYALSVLVTPPSEVMSNLGSSQRNDLFRMQNGLKVKHKIRISNKSENPFTTAPAMIMRDGLIIAQGMMTYTPVGGDVDVELTTAVDISVKKVDNETKRTPIKWDGSKYARIDLDGKITLVNYKKEPVTVEVTRYVLGNVDAVGQNGEKEMLNPFEDSSFLSDKHTAGWWYSYSWPWWWYHFNGIGKIKWTTTIESGESAEHTYNWHYFWR